MYIHTYTCVYIYCEPAYSIPLLYSVLLLRAGSYVKAMNHVQLNDSRGLNPPSSISLSHCHIPFLKSVTTPSVDYQVNFLPVRDITADYRVGIPLFVIVRLLRFTLQYIRLFNHY